MRDCKAVLRISAEVEAEIVLRIASGDLKKLAEDAMKQTRLLVNNPRELSFDDALAIYTEAFGNRAAA